MNTAEIIQDAIRAVRPGAQIAGITAWTIQHQPTFLKRKYGRC
jgi:hypothetical protein